LIDYQISVLFQIHNTILMFKGYTVIIIAFSETPIGNKKQSQKHFKRTNKFFSLSFSLNAIK